MEKTLDSKMSGVMELGREELQQTNGGMPVSTGWSRLLYLYLGLLASELVTEGIDQCIKDFKEGFNETFKY